MLQIAVLGYGTVGSGVVEVIEKNQELISKKVGDSVYIKHVLDLRDFPGDPIQERVVHDYTIIVNDPEIKVVVEVMGGINPAYEFVKEALLAGKSVATSNKALVAKHGAELLAIAKEKNVNFFFEASVGGGIPIIRPLNTSLTADDVDEISGILNGTTNYMLSKMTFEGLGFDSVLKDAQSKGYAESNPEADIEGHDACRKIAILTSLIMGQQVNFEEIPTEGITNITAEDIKYAEAMGRRIKLLATSKKENGMVYAMVAPFLVSADHALYGINDVFNAIFVHGNMLGDAMFYGSGAGKLPTASAVVADVIDALRRTENAPVEWKPEPLRLADVSGAKRRFFVRLKGDIAQAKAMFGDDMAKGWSVSNIVDGECGFITNEITEKQFEAITEARSENIVNRIRLL